MSNARLDVLIWVLIYGGLLIVSLGIFLRRTAEGLGWVLIAAGALVAAAGAALVLVRARRGPEYEKKSEKQSDKQSDKQNEKQAKR